MCARSYSWVEFTPWLAQRDLKILVPPLLTFLRFEHIFIQQV